MRIRTNAALLIFFSLFCPVEGLPAERAAAPVRAIKVEGTINPATAGYIIRALKEANRLNEGLVLIELDTPGGLVDSTKDIIKEMLASDVPVAVYVSPQGAMASSAGTFITVAAQVAAMAPTTHIGSATPISGQGGEDLERKVTYAMASYMKTLAERRGRNAEWAVKAVEKGISATETEALKLKVIDLIAASREELLRKIDGRKVNVNRGDTVIRTKGAPVRDMPMSSQERLMHFLANPNVLSILILIAIYGIIGEISNPGGILPGVAGGIALILVFFSANLLPLNITALLLIAFAIILFIIDTQVASHGILSAGGALSLGLGLFLLVDVSDPLFRTSLALVIMAALVTTAFFTFAVGAGLRVQKRKVTTGREGLVGRVVEARTDIAPVGRVFVDGAWWTAETPGEPIRAGEMVEVKAVRGLRLLVEKR